MFGEKKYDVTELSLFQKVFIISAVSILLIFIGVLLGSKQAHALVGDATGLIPNNGSSIPWLILTRPGTNGMDAPQTTNFVCIPVASGTSFNMTITDACDGTVNDASGTSNDSVFFFDGAHVSNVTTSSPGTFVTTFFGSWLIRCDSGTSSVLTVTMNASAPTITIGGVQYRALVLTASTSNSSSLNYYANRFRYNAVSGIKFAYNTTAVQPTQSIQYTGIAYSNGGTNSWGWSTAISFALPCGAAAQTGKEVYFFDTDHRNAATSTSPYWQNTTQPMRYTIRSYNRQTDALVATIYNNEWLTGGQDVHEATRSFTIDSRYKYTIEISNVNFVNSIQVALPVNSVYSADPCTNNPIGTIDSCVLSGNNTILYGWAYDSNATTADQPQVTVNSSGGVTSQTVNTPFGYRAAQINAYLDSINYLGNRGDLYGFRVTLSGLSRGSTYTLSGTALNVGIGSNVALGVNQAVGPPAGGVAGSSGFPSSRIPGACLPIAIVAPTCIAAGGTFNIGVSNRLTTARLTNTNTVPLTVSSATYSITNSAGTVVASGSDTTGLDVPASSFTNYDGQNHALMTVGTYTANWTINWAAGATSGTRTCNGPITIVYQPLTCGVIPAIVQEAGLGFTATAPINNPNPVPVAITSANYAIPGTSPDRTGTASNPTASINSSSNYTYEFSENINRPSKIKNGAGGSYTNTWTIVSVAGTLTCTNPVTIEVTPPSCTPDPISAGTGELFRPRVTVSNPNLAINMQMTGIAYVINPGGYSGSVPPDEMDDEQVIANSNRTYAGSATSIPAAGQYATSWNVDWSVTPLAGSVACPVTANDTTVSNQAYVRFYGNDVFAGGGFGSGCSAVSTADARGYGRNITGQPYVGTASELAVFAVGLIQNVLPGSQRDRIGRQELGFSNTTSAVDVATGSFGGGFGMVSCSPDYYADAITAQKFTDQNVNLDTLNSGRYSFGTGAGSTTDFSTRGGVPDGKKLVIYVDGNARLLAGTGNRFGYANTAGVWGSFADLPSLYIIASGNIYIDNDVTVMDGAYIAQPRSGIESTTGQIYTCSQSSADPLGDLSNTANNSNAGFIYSDCNNQLVVNGAFVAKRVHLLRSYGTVNDAKAFETYKDPTNHMSEIFRFTPEMYFSDGGGLPPRSTNAKIDSIVSLPPAF